MRPRILGDVTLPRRPVSGLRLLGWCNDVMVTLQQLRDRIVDYRPPPRMPSKLTGNFCTQYTVTVDPTTTLYLLGGVVSGGTGNIAVADITLATVGSEPADGTYVWLEVDFTAYTEDGVLLPGGDVTAVVADSGTTIPDNVIPTAVDPDGMVVVTLGLWSQGIFTPSACGNIQINHCLGSLTHNH